MAEDSDLEKTEPASPWRIEKAREDRHVPQSCELPTFLVLIAGIASLWVISRWLMQRTQVLLKSGFSFDRNEAFPPEFMFEHLVPLSWDAILALAPFMMVMMLAALALVTAIDVPVQLWRYYDQLKMTKEALKQEYKEQEGDRQLKGRIRARQREMARRRMMAAVPKADVVVTNPTHYAVALKYEASAIGAPTVVAKGADLVVAVICELAVENDVPLLEAPPLARALFRHSEVGEAYSGCALYGGG